MELVAPKEDKLLFYWSAEEDLGLMITFWCSKSVRSLTVAVIWGLQSLRNFWLENSPGRAVIWLVARKVDSLHFWPIDDGKYCFQSVRLDVLRRISTLWVQFVSISDGFGASNSRIGKAKSRWTVFDGLCDRSHETLTKSLKIKRSRVWNWDMMNISRRWVSACWLHRRNWWLTQVSNRLFYRSTGEWIVSMSRFLMY